MIFLFSCDHVTTEFVRCLSHTCLSCPLTVPFPPSLWIRPNSKTGHDYERLKLQCMKAMADLQSLQNQHSTTLKRCEEAVKKADFYQWVEKPTTGPFLNVLTACTSVPKAFELCLQGFSSLSVGATTFRQIAQNRFYHCECNGDESFIAIPAIG